MGAGVISSSSNPPNEPCWAAGLPAGFVAPLSKPENIESQSAFELVADGGAGPWRADFVPAKGESNDGGGAGPCMIPLVPGKLGPELDGALAEAGAGPAELPSQGAKEGWYADPDGAAPLELLP